MKTLNEKYILLRCVNNPNKIQWPSIHLWKKCGIPVMRKCMIIDMMGGLPCVVQRL